MFLLSWVLSVTSDKTIYKCEIHISLDKVTSRMEETNEKRRVTKSAVVILLSVMFQRYSTGVIASILVLFLNLKLGFDKDESTAIFHAYAFLSSLFAIIGAVIADSWLGMYKSIILMCLVLAVGSITIAIAVIDALHLPLITFSIVALIVMSFGDGCLKPLGRAYGAYQYDPTETKSIALFFVLYYFMYNCGSILSRIVSPILRQEVRCFGNDDCFTLAFGIPGIFILLAAILIILANRYSETSQANGSTLLNVLACIWHAIAMKIKSRNDRNISKKHHWLGYSEAKYGKTLVWETQHILRVGCLCLPIMLFWALFYQQGSRWVFQAVRMNGDLGFYTIIPDQLPVINPLLVLLLIPVFEYVIYPLLLKVGIRNDLGKVTLGGVLAGFAFIISALVESQIGNDKHLHMTWLIPQYVVMTMGEILVTIPMMNFSYAVAPSSMKTILQAFNNLSVGLGNLIVVVVVGSKVIESQIYEFILFATLMFVDMGIFAFLASRFKRLKTNEGNS